MQWQGAEWGAWIALKMVRGVGNILGLNLLRVFGAPGAVFTASSHALECAGVRRSTAHAIRAFDRWADVEQQLARIETCGARLVTWQDASYPDNLRHIHDAPLFLFVKGELIPEDALAIAIVGSRSVSAYGRQMTRTLGAGLARYGVTVVSGLARGVDAEAHASAVRAGGRTIAVLGSGIDVIYPSEHHQLHMRIAEQGAVVSELLMGTQPDAENFPGRNRIISGLSLGTVVVEAAEKSGSLITADDAADQGREIFAVPGPVGARTRGVHRLIRQGATLVERAEDILEEIAPHVLARVARAPALELDGDETEIFRCLDDDTSVHVDRVIARTGFPAAKVLDVLLRLEVRGLVVQNAGKYFARISGAALRVETKQ
jgi:DNA processing protein